MTLVALLSVLAVGVWGAFAVFAAAPGPTVSSFTLNGTTPTNASSMSWKVVFSSAVTGVAASNFTAVPGGAVAVVPGPVSVAVVNSSTYTVTVTTTATSGSGTLGLNLSSAGSIKDASNNKPLQGAPYTGPVYTVDLTAPTAAITFPANGGSYNLATYNAGCSPTGICGTASDSNTVASVRVSVKGPNLKYWDGSNFANSSETFKLATGTTAWKYTLPAGPDGAYVVHVQGTDSFGNQQTGTTYAASASFTLDATPPTLTPSITAGPANGSTVASTSATFSFTDSESGVTLQCQLDGAAFAACSSPKAYTGLGQGAHTFVVRAVDAAGNPSPTAFRGWTVDTVGPPKPTIVGPNNNNPSSSASFQITDSESGVAFQCSLDGSSYTACTSPKNYFLLAAGTHVFDARAVDAAGNIGDFNEWKWTISGNSGAGLPFTIDGNAVGLLYPGATTATPIAVTFHNPNSVPIYVTAFTTGLGSGSLPAGCQASWFPISQSNISMSNSVTVPAKVGSVNGSVTLPHANSNNNGTVTAPTIRMTESGNQSVCRGANLQISYTLGSAQS
jgi:hypothetical protein